MQVGHIFSGEWVVAPSRQLAESSVDWSPPHHVAVWQPPIAYDEVRLFCLRDCVQRHCAYYCWSASGGVRSSCCTPGVTGGPPPNAVAPKKDSADDDSNESSFGRIASESKVNFSLPSGCAIVSSGTSYPPEGSSFIHADLLKSSPPLFRTVSCESPARQVPLHNTG